MCGGHDANLMNISNITMITTFRSKEAYITASYALCFLKYLRFIEPGSIVGPGNLVYNTDRNPKYLGPYVLRWKIETHSKISFFYSAAISEQHFAASALWNVGVVPGHCMLSGDLSFTRTKTVIDIFNQVEILVSVFLKFSKQHVQKNTCKPQMCKFQNRTSHEHQFQRVRK